MTLGPEARVVVEPTAEPPQVQLAILHTDLAGRRLVRVQTARVPRRGSSEGVAESFSEVKHSGVTHSSPGELSSWKCWKACRPGLPEYSSPAIAHRRCPVEDLPTKRHRGTGALDYEDSTLAPLPTSTPGVECKTDGTVLSLRTTPRGPPCLASRCRWGQVQTTTSTSSEYRSARPGGLRQDGRDCSLVIERCKSTTTLSIQT